MRDNLATPEFWQRALEEQELDIGAYRAAYENGLRRDHKPGASQGEKGYPLHDALIRSALASYSAGLGREEVMAPAAHAVSALFVEMIQRFGTKMPDGIARGSYDSIHRQIALLVLCCASREDARAYFEALDQFDLNEDGYGGYDEIWNAYRGYFGLPPKSVGEKIHWPEAYENLWKAIDPAEPQFARPHHLKKFLDGWYSEMASELAAGTTLGEDLSPNSSYVGYWCLEAAAAAVAFNIDDTELRRQPYYPYEWADWARKCRIGLST